MRPAPSPSCEKGKAEPRGWKKSPLSLQPVQQPARINYTPALTHLSPRRRLGNRGLLIIHICSPALCALVRRHRTPLVSVRKAPWLCQAGRPGPSCHRLLETRRAAGCRVSRASVAPPSAPVSTNRICPSPAQAKTQQLGGWSRRPDAQRLQKPPQRQGRGDLGDLGQAPAIPPRPSGQGTRAEMATRAPPRMQETLSGVRQLPDRERGV